MHVLYGFFLLSVLIAIATFTTLLHTLDHVTQYVAAACVAANMVVVVGAHILYWNVHFEEFQEAIPRMHRVRIGQQVTPEAEEPLHAPQAPVQAPLTRASLIELANQRGESLSLTSEDFEPPLLMPPPAVAAAMAALSANRLASRARITTSPSLGTTSSRSDAI